MVEFVSIKTVLIMKSRIFNKSLLLICISTLFLTGCKGSAGKKAATEVIEIIEKKGASKAGSVIEREATQVERNAAREAEGYNSGRSHRTHRPRHNSYDDDESSYEQQVYTVQCTQCSGSGIVYVVDSYGNVQYDYYGTPLISQCPSCGGSGTRWVSE